MKKTTLLAIVAICLAVAMWGRHDRTRQRTDIRVIDVQGTTTTATEMSVGMLIDGVPALPASPLKRPWPLWPLNVPLDDRLVDFAAAIGLTVEVPSATVASLDAGERLGDYGNTVVRWQQDVSRAKVELGVEGKWSYDTEAARFSGGWSNRSYYLWRVDTAPPNDGVAVVRLDSPAGENSTWALSVAPGDCLPDEALPGWRCGLDLVDLNRRYDDRQIVAYGDQLFSLANWQGAGTPTPLVKVTQQPGHVVVRVDPRCSRTEWGATCPPGADE